MGFDRLLVAAGAGADALGDLPAGVRGLIDAANEILVMAPALPTRLQWLASDTDKTRERADERLRTVLGQLDDPQTEVHGRVGADDPLLAFDEAVADFNPDHILVALRPEKRSGWQEKGLVDQLLERFDQPITAFRVKSA